MTLYGKVLKSGTFPQSLQMRERHSHISHSPGDDDGIFKI
jgi:hypothetical protein